MLTVESESGQKIHAMVMKEPTDRCIGVVQCALDGCQAYMPIVADDESAKAQIEWFMKHHECRAPERER